MSQKNRNAYKRYWRNRRNMIRAHREMVEAAAKLARSRTLMYEAQNEMAHARG